MKCLVLFLLYCLPVMCQGSEPEAAELALQGIIPDIGLWGIRDVCTSFANERSGQAKLVADQYDQSRKRLIAEHGPDVVYTEYAHIFTHTVPANQQRYSLVRGSESQPPFETHIFLYISRDSTTESAKEYLSQTFDSILLRRAPSY